MENFDPSQYSSHDKLPNDKKTLFKKVDGGFVYDSVLSEDGAWGEAVELMEKINNGAVNYAEAEALFEEFKKRTNNLNQGVEDYLIKYLENYEIKQEFEKAKTEHPELGSNVKIIIEFIRHGATMPDGSLSKDGEKQASRLGEGLNNSNDYDSVVGLASSLIEGGNERALKTMLIALENTPEIKNH